MSPWLARSVAVLMLALGIAPFTAPFPTCDLGTFTGHSHHDNDQTKDDHTTHRALVKWSAPNKTPILAEDAASTTPLFVALSSETGAHHLGVSIREALRLVLRI